jgi:hypothetical protein
VKLTRQTTENRRRNGLLSASATVFLTGTKLAKIETAEPRKKRPDVKRVKIYYGPFTLLGANVSSSALSSIKTIKGKSKRENLLICVCNEGDDKLESTPHGS